MREKYRESIQPSENCVTYMFNKKEQYKAVENVGKVNIFTFLPAKTDNIMDYSEENKNDNHQTFTYKWQWDKIKEVAEDRNIHVKLERENGNESKE